MRFSVPILFIVFNRTDTALRVLDQIRIIKPEKLYFAADAPRSDKGEAELIACQEARAILELVDWPCEIKTLFPQKNVGARKFIGDAISWMFESEEEGIVLEHDCLPHIDFFNYCSTMLDWYRHENRVMHISGTQFRDLGKGSPEIFFSHYNHIWGWATWKRAWRNYDLEMNDLEGFFQRGTIKHIFPEKVEQDYWSKKLRQAQSGEIKSWDFQWTFALWNNDGVAIVPGSNLISNIGFGSGAIHTKDKNHFLSNRPVYPFDIIKLKRPNTIRIDRITEKFDFENVFYPPFYKRVLNKIKLWIASV